MLEPGDTVENHWEVISPLDTGSMSVVFRGRDVTDDHSVAIKVMKPDVARDPIAVQRCIREARLIQTLSHPNIVRVEGAGQTADQRPYIVMELLEGETLEARATRMPLERGVVTDVITQVGAAIDAAHAAGIVHRDLKPDNVFLLRRADDRVHVKLLDFGFAKLTNDQDNTATFRTESNALLGTPLYMSPEQIRASRDVDFRADLWSLGVMAYELIVGEAPFESRPVVDLFVEILSAPIPPPSQRVPDLPAAVDSWAARALDRAPARRFQSGKALSEALISALQGHPTEPPQPPAAHSLRWPGPSRSAPRLPRRWVMVVAGLAVLAMVSVAAFVGTRTVHVRDRLAPITGP